MCGVGKFMKRWKYWNTDQCPRCGEAEDAPHVWTCSDPGARDIWNKSVDSLDLFLRKQDTDPTLLHIIKVYLQSWQTGVAISYSPPRAFEQLIQEQSQIGWHRFFEGWFSPGWRDAQQRYYLATRSTRTGRRWVTALIQKFWDIAWDLWEHRNGVLHEKENLVTESLGLHLNRRVTRVFLALCSRALRATDRHLVQLPLSKLLERNANYKTQWLEVAEPTLRVERRQVWQDNHRVTRMVTGMRNCLLSWLSRSGSA